MKLILLILAASPNKLLAKLASDFQKPDGLTLIRDSEKVEFLKPLPGTHLVPSKSFALSRTLKRTADNTIALHCSRYLARM
jgi:hypothetical protein